MTKTRSQKSFNCAMIGLGLLAIMIILAFSKSSLFSNVVGLLVSGIGISSILGTIYTIKGIKEPNTIKKIVGMIINFGFLGLYLSMIIINIFDIYKAFA